MKHIPGCLTKSVQLWCFVVDYITTFGLCLERVQTFRWIRFELFSVCTIKKAAMVLNSNHNVTRHLTISLSFAAVYSQRFLTMLPQRCLPCWFSIRRPVRFAYRRVWWKWWCAYRNTFLMYCVCYCLMSCWYEMPSLILLFLFFSFCNKIWSELMSLKYRYPGELSHFADWAVAPVLFKLALVMEQIQPGGVSLAGELTVCLSEPE